MIQHITRYSPLAKMLAEVTNVPVERIEDFVILVQHDRGIAMLHTLCCTDHAREGLFRIAATPPDVPDTSDFTGSN